MKIKDLKEMLNKLDDNLDIIIPNGEGGYYDVDDITEIIFVKNFYDTSYYGPHEIIEDGDKKEYKDLPRFKGVLLS